MHPRPLAAATALALVAVPASAQAAGKTVYAGPHKQAKSAPDGSDFNAYFPKKIKVARGGTVTFQFRGFHDVFFKKQQPLVTADPSKPISGVNDAAGKPFWFNGQPRLVVNPLLLGPQGDGKVDGKGTDSSGLPLDDKPKPYKVKFTKTGTHKYYCSVHPGMTGSVTVVKKRRKVPSTAADTRAADTQLAKAVKTVTKNDKFAGPGGTEVRVGNDTKDTSLFKFFPSTIAAKVGQPITFVMDGDSPEAHTATVAPEDYLKAQTDTLFAPDMSTTPPAIVLNPILFLPSDPPNAFPAFTKTLHGNGFLNTGVLDNESKSPSPNRAALTFAEAGTYTVYCALHAPDMKMTVNVSA